MMFPREGMTRNNHGPSIERSVMRAFSVIATEKLARRAVRKTYRLMGTFSSKTGFNPVIELPLERFGIDARFRFHLLRRDLTFLFQSFVLHVYERYCKLEPGDVVVDCGAYIGDFTARASKQVGPEGLVLAFEPNPHSYSLCHRNILANRLANVKLYNVALGEKQKTAFLDVDKINPGITKVIDEARGEDGESIPVRPLSEFLTNIDNRPVKLLKMHVEGDAVRILTGSVELLEKKVFQNICVELHPGEEGLPSLLEWYGYECTVEGVYLYASASTSTPRPKTSRKRFGEAQNSPQSAC
jgi:FkbM family methyltransferase